MAPVNIKEEDIYLILKKINPGNAHRWKNISIRMIQLCRKAVVEPLRVLFFSFVEEGTYPDDWKKSNVVSILKKESKNFIKNYRPISLLSVFSKVFQKITFNFLLNYFLENKIFTKCQSGFSSEDPCTSQFLSITHEIFKSFDVTETFIDI